MLAAINQWVFPNDMPACDALQRVKEAGFDAFEVCVGTSGPVSLDASESEVTGIRVAAEKLGLQLTSVGCGVGWELPLSSPDPDVAAKAIEANSKALRIARWLGVDTVLVVPGVVTPEVSYDTALVNARATIERLERVAANEGVCLALENVWNNFLVSPVEMREYIDAFGSEYVGAYFDIGNILLYGFPEHWIRILGKRIRMMHAKDYRVGAGGFHGFVMLLEGNVNWPAVRAAMRDIGYDKAMVAEFGPYAHSLGGTLTHVHSALREIIAM
jgi:hexulose-6-phosphate isomerase